MNIMKSVVSHKDNNYSLNNSENYRKTIECSLGEVTKKYGDLLIEYSNFISENIKVKNTSFSRFIIIRGLDTITNVFLNIFNATKNIDLTYFHCQKSFYFYVEFVGQISDDEKTFLQLTSRDATTYVYKKTVFDINNEFKKQNEIITDELKEKMNIIKSYVNLYQTYLLKIIKSDKLNINDLDYVIKIYDKLNNLHNKSSIVVLENITEKLFYKIEDLNKFYELCILIVKKFVKNSEIFKNANKKLNSEEFNDKIVESSEIFIAWLGSSI
jgi:hypothetical protein